jgi:3-oxoacyl-[acyl-carrier protein] reductase
VNLGIEGKRALVTGGSKGIGRAIVGALEAEGCLVDSLSRSNGFDALQPWTYPTGPLRYDILVNNVGGGGRWGTDYFETTPEQVWRDVMDKNFWAALKFVQLCLPEMDARRWGRVVTISSIFGKEAGKARPWFVCAKAAEIAFMKSMANYHVLEGITFNTVCPGPIDIGDGAGPGKPEHVAPLVAFLCSRQAAHITGACITCDGGESKSF